MTEEFQLESGYSGKSVFEEKTEEQKNTEEITNFIFELSEAEKGYLENYSKANNDSKLTVDDFRQELQSFRSKRAEEFSRVLTLEERLKKATDKEAEELLLKYGLLPNPKSKKKINWAR